MEPMPRKPTKSGRSMPKIVVPIIAAAVGLYFGFIQAAVAGGVALALMSVFGETMFGEKKANLRDPLAALACLPLGLDGPFCARRGCVGVGRTFSSCVDTISPHLCRAGSYL